ncbi:MAG: PorT family protein [Spirochaetaceae bacterium]|nr:PorT family protein [Spirochaetaceae bacterium]
MKKIGLILVCLLIATSLFATDNKFGIALGLNNSFVTGSDWKDFVDGVETGANARPIWHGETPGPGISTGTAFTLGVEVGLFFEIAINEMFSIQPEINIIQTSIKMTAEATGQGETSLTVRTTYFEIPLLARINFDAGPGKMAILVGPSLFLNPMKSEREWNKDAAGGEDTTVEEGAALVAAVIGVGYALPAGNGTVLFDLRYRRMFSAMNWVEVDNMKGSNAPYMGTDGGKHNARPNIISLRLGYGFSL